MPVLEITLNLYVRSAMVRSRRQVGYKGASAFYVAIPVVFCVFLTVVYFAYYCNEKKNSTKTAFHIRQVNTPTAVSDTEDTKGAVDANISNSNAVIAKAEKFSPPVVPKYSLPAESNRCGIPKDTVFKIVSSLFNTPNDKRDRTELMTVLYDETSSPAKRCNAAFLLAREANDVTIDLLKNLFYDQDTDPQLKAAILAGIGYSNNPLKTSMIWDGLEDGNEEVVCGAIRGLQGFTEDYAVEALVSLVNFSQSSSKVKSEVIASLGEIKNPTATQVLVDLYKTFSEQGNVSFLAEIVTAAGHRDIEQIRPFLENVLNDERSDASVRLALAESLENSSQQVSFLLLPLLQDPDNQVREAAAWSLATTETTGDIASELITAVKQEMDSEVRKRLFQALQEQENFNVAEILPIISAETDVSAKIAGYDVVSTRLYEKDTQTQNWFIEQALPILKDAALNGEKLSVRLSAVIVLKKAGISESEHVLAEIAEISTDPKVVRAAEIKEKF
jgi:HEAT repeat protein